MPAAVSQVHGGVHLAPGSVHLRRGEALKADFDVEQELVEPVGESD